MANLHESNNEKKFELLGAYKPYPYVFVSNYSIGKYLVYNKSRNRLVKKEVLGFQLKEFDGTEGELERLVGKENIHNVSEEDMGEYNDDTNKTENEDMEKKQYNPSKDAIHEFFYWLITGKHSDEYKEYKGIIDEPKKPANPESNIDNKYYLIYVQYNPSSLR